MKILKKSIMKLKIFTLKKKVTLIKRKIFEPKNQF